MQLTHRFTLSVPVDHAWPVLTDLRRLAPCVPGLVEGEAGPRSALPVRVGPATATYEGSVQPVERDDATHRAVLRAVGRDVRTGDDAHATVVLWLSSRGAGAEVLVEADVELTGPLGLLGPGVLAAAGGTLLAQFARRLAAEVARAAEGRHPDGHQAPRTTTTPAPTAPTTLAGARPAAAAVALAGGLGLVLGRLLGRHAGRRGAGRP